MKRFLACAAVLPLTACASIFEGTTQDITVNTNPGGADCAFVREAQQIAHVSATPATVNIKKTKHDITIICNKPGYQQATYLNHSGAAGAAFGNLLLGIIGGGIGWGVDSARGADNKYDSTVNISMVPEVAAAPQPAVLPLTPAGGPPLEPMPAAPVALAPAESPAPAALAPVAPVAQPQPAANGAMDNYMSKANQPVRIPPAATGSGQ